VRSQGGKSPAPSEHPSRGTDSFEQRLVTGRLSPREKVPHNYIVLLLIKALRRCGYRCPITGVVDKLSPDRTSSAYGNTLEGAHIIPHHLSEAKTELEVFLSCFTFLKSSKNKRIKCGRLWVFSRDRRFERNLTVKILIPWIISLS